MLNNRFKRFNEIGENHLKTFLLFFTSASTKCIGKVIEKKKSGGCNSSKPNLFGN
jgi:hypothetical protein